MAWKNANSNLVRKRKCSTVSDELGYEPSGGLFAGIGKRVSQANANRKAAKAEAERLREEERQRAGSLVTKGNFGEATVEIYSNGYVRVHGTIAINPHRYESEEKAPFEKLKSINYSGTGQSGAAQSTSALQTVVGPAMAGLLKGGSGLLKASVPGMAAMGISHVVAQTTGASQLTITTDRDIYTLKNVHQGEFLKTVVKEHVAVGLELAATGTSVIEALRNNQRALQLEQALVGHTVSTPSAPTMADKLRELADLHREGVLSDEEFAQAKASLLSNL